MQDSTGSPRPSLEPSLPPLEYASVDACAGAGTGVGTMVCDFLCGSVGVSVAGNAALVCFLLRQPNGKGSYGMEGFVVFFAVAGAVLLNATMAAAVYVGASKKRKALGRPVAVRPRWHMVVAGILTPIVGIPFAMFTSSVMSIVGGSFPGLGIPVFMALASFPAGFAAWSMAGPRE
jgi:hypothetical protein